MVPAAPFRGSGSVPVQIRSPPLPPPHTARPAPGRNRPDTRQPVQRLRADKILKGVVMNTHVGCVIVIAYFSIGPPDQADTGSPVTVSKSRPEDKFKSPQGFFHQSLVQQRVPSPLCGKLQQAFYRLCRLDCLLGHISCIMPAAAVWQALPHYVLRKHPCGRVHACPEPDNHTVRRTENLSLSTSPHPEHRL